MQGHCKAIFQGILFLFYAESSKYRPGTESVEPENRRSDAHLQTHGMPAGLPAGHVGHFQAGGSCTMAALRPKPMAVATHVWVKKRALGCGLATGVRASPDHALVGT